MAKITGTFVDFSVRTHGDHELLDRTEEDWREEMLDMRRAGITLLIPARAMMYGRTYYHSDHFETWEERDYLTPFMNAARDVGMRVMLSGFLSKLFWQVNDDDFVRMMKRDANIYRVLFDEQLQRYGDYSNLAGFYVSHEADYQNCKSDRRKVALQQFMGSVYAHLKRQSPLPVMSSPFFCLELPPAALADWWDGVVDRPMCDVIAMQDGVGCSRGIGVEHVEPYFRALQPVFQNKGLDFWHNLETFSMNPGIKTLPCDPKLLWFAPAPIDRVDQQFEAAQQFVSRTITWEYGHFLSRQQVGADWYGTFRRWNVGVEALV